MRPRTTRIRAHAWCGVLRIRLSNELASGARSGCRANLRWRRQHPHARASAQHSIWQLFLSFLIANGSARTLIPHERVKLVPRTHTNSASGSRFVLPKLYTPRDLFAGRARPPGSATSISAAVAARSRKLNTRAASPAHSTRATENRVDTAHPRLHGRHTEGSWSNRIQSPPVDAQSRATLRLNSDRQAVARQLRTHRIHDHSGARSYQTEQVPLFRRAQRTRTTVLEQEESSPTPHQRQRAELTWRRTQSSGTPPNGVVPELHESRTMSRPIEHEVRLAADITQTHMIPAQSPSPEALRQMILDNPTTERLAEDVLRRVDRRLRIERERRGIG